MAYADHLKSFNQGADPISGYNASKECTKMEISWAIKNNARKDSSILEIGPGFGYLSKYLIEMGFINLTIVDQCPKLLESARAICNHSSVKSFCTDAISYLKKSKKKYEYIFMFDVIEHFCLSDLQELCPLLRGSLNPNGRFIFRTPNMASPLGTYSRYIDITHQIGFTEHSLCQLLRDNGFSVVQFYDDYSVTRRLPIRERIVRRLYLKALKALYSLEHRTAPSYFGKNLVGCASA
jgi:2-polyprenyl-3-methyl-5-hydroxy-6-metoxy-1,4-benzoquinol methylase